MKKAGIILTSLIFMISLSSSAQMMQGKNQQNEQQQSMMMHRADMMQGNMMNGGMCPMQGMMMNGKAPMMNIMMTLNRLPNMQEQFSLTDQQVHQLIDLQTDFKKQQVGYQAELTKMKMRNQKMFEEMPSSAELKKQLQKCADIRINMNVAAYETLKQMKALLTDKQKENLENMMMNQNNRMQGNIEQGGMMQNTNKQ